MVIAWNTGLAAERARHNLRLKNKKNKKQQAAGGKRQATSNKPPAGGAGELARVLKPKKNATCG